MISVHAPDPMFISGSLLVQCQSAQESHFLFTSSTHVQPVKISLYFILYFAAIVPIQCRQMLRQEYIAEEPSVTHRAWVPNLTVFPKQLAACTPFHPSAETGNSIPFPCFIGLGSFNGAPILSNFPLLGDRSISHCKWKYDSLLSYRQNFIFSSLLT